MWNQNTLRAWGPTRASTVTYITPIVGVVLGVSSSASSCSWNEPVGALVVFLGILLAQNRLRRSQGSAPRQTRRRPDASASAPS